MTFEGEKSKFYHQVLKSIFGQFREFMTNTQIFSHYFLRDDEFFFQDFWVEIKIIRTFWRKNWGLFDMFLCQEGGGGSEN